MRCLHKLLFWEHLGDYAHLECLLRREYSTRHENVRRVGQPSDSLYDEVRRQFRHHSAASKYKAHFCTLGGQANVTQHRIGHADAHCCAIYCCNNRFIKLVRVYITCVTALLLTILPVSALVTIRKGVPASFKVCARTKRSSRTGQDDSPDFVI